MSERSGRPRGEGPCGILTKTAQQRHRLTRTEAMMRLPALGNTR